MTRFVINIGALLVVALLLQGCGAGYNHVLFMTKSNVGLDIDTEPPTLDVNFNRREFVIEPTFEEGKTLPVQASFRSSTGGLANFLFGVGSTFTTGEAAVAMTELYDEDDAKPEQAESHVTLLDGVETRKIEFRKYNGEELVHEPKKKKLFGQNTKSVAFLEPGLVKPVVFGTDTQLGVGVKWNNPTSPVPQSLKVGFNRSEGAWAPVTIKELTGADKTNPLANYRVNMPSLLASIESNVSISTMNGSTIRSLQYFATGKAATNLALRRDVRKAMLEQANPVLKLKTEEEKLAITTEAKDLQTWLETAPNSATKNKRVNIIKAWIASTYPGASFGLMDLVYFSDHPTEQKALHAYLKGLGHF